MSNVITKPEELPEGESFAILSPDSISSIDDYGPPDSPTRTTHSFVRITLFRTRDEWLAAIRRAAAGPDTERRDVPCVIRRIKTSLHVHIEGLTPD